MRLSWVGKSAVIAAGVSLLAVVLIQVFWPSLFYLDSLDFIWIGYPLMLIASLAAWKFLRNTKEMPTSFRIPWVSYSWSVLLFTGGITVHLLLCLFGPGLKNDFYNDSFIALLSLATTLSVPATFFGLSKELRRFTHKKPNSVFWIFVLIGAVLIVLDFIPQIKSNSDLEVILLCIVICLIPIYMCVSIIRKNEGYLALIYKYIFISQLAFIFLLIACTLTYANASSSLLIALPFFSFAIAFDLRLSLYLTEQKAICLETETPNQVEVEP